jgi:hypothetical protein
MPALSVEVKPDPIVASADASRSRRPLPDKVKALLDDLHRGEATADRCAARARVCGVSVQSCLV